MASHVHRQLGNPGRHVLTSRIQRAGGFTLIEMVVTMTIFALLVALTIPTMRTWVADAKVRAVAESLQNGIRLAQTEALRRGRQVVFTFTNTANPQVGFTGGSSGNYWAAQTIPLDPSEAAVVVGSGPLTAAGSTVTISGFVVSLCFNSVGRLVTNVSTGVAGAVCIAPIAVANGSLSWPLTVSNPLADHSLVVAVALGGQIRMCDPSQTLSANNPYGC
jgi:type IV fimbrial biogenesis protein FimT